MAIEMLKFKQLEFEQQKTILLIILILTLGYFIMPTTWWDTDWKKKQQITIENTDVEVYNYTIKLRIEHDFDMTPDFSDIRFINNKENKYRRNKSNEKTSIDNHIYQIDHILRIYFITQIIHLMPPMYLHF